MKALVALLVFVAAVSAGCGRANPPPPRQASSPPAPLASWTIKLQAPDAIPADEPVPLTATVDDSAGKPVDGADVEASLKMKTMDMGENKSKLTETRPGVYSGKATFTMAGPWEVEVRAMRKGLTAIEHFSYDVQEKPAGK